METGDVYGMSAADNKKALELIDERKSGNAFTPRIVTQDAPHAWMAKATGTITARLGATLGSGTAKLQRVSSGSIVDYVEVDGSTTYSFTVYNLTTTEIPTNAYFFCYREFPTGTWIVADIAGCANPVNDVYLDGLTLKLVRCDGTEEDIFTGTECP